MSYLPLGDDDDFDWQRDNITVDSLLKVLREKEQKGELVGIVMTWKDTNIGGEFLLRNDGRIFVNLSMNLKLIESGMKIQITDLNWYLIKLLPAFSQDDLQVESFLYEEHQ